MLNLILEIFLYSVIWKCPSNVKWVGRNAQKKIENNSLPNPKFNEIHLYDDKKVYEYDFKVLIKSNPLWPMQL